MTRPEVLLSEEQIAKRVAEIGSQITANFQGEEVILICLLNGAFIFCSDLMRKIELPLKVDFVALSSYGDEIQSSQEVVCDWDCKFDIRDRNIIIVEDIVDTGLTLKHFLQMLRLRRPKSIKIAALLFKPSRNQYPVPIDYLGFEIKDLFVVGYGLDYAQRYRELPYIGVLSADF